MRKRLERINAAPDAGISKTRARIRDAIPSVDELSSAVSRINMAPWEDPFALALGEGNSISEEAGRSALLRLDRVRAHWAEPAPTLAGVEAEVPVAPTPSSLEQADDDSFVEVEDNRDDKMKRIAKTLQAGDVVEQAHVSEERTLSGRKQMLISRTSYALSGSTLVVSVQAATDRNPTFFNHPAGLLIFGRKNMYLIDSLVYTNEGEVIDAKDAPRDVLSIPSGTLVELDPAEQLSLRWFVQQLYSS